mgnify:CR=1 FL=1
MEWYEKLGFDENPFSTDSRLNHDKLVNMDGAIEEIFYRINSGSMLAVEGKEGNGKTTLLMIAAEKFGGKKNVVYLDCKILDKKLNITKVLQERYGFFGRLLDKKPKNMVVLMDNVDRLSEKNTERLKYYFDQNYIKSIIFATSSYKRAKFSDSLRDRIGRRLVILPKLTDEDAVDIIRNRIGESELFNDSLIKKIFNISKNSVKELLKNCEAVAMSAAKKKRKRAQAVDLKVLENVV